MLLPVSDSKPLTIESEEKATMGSLLRGPGEPVAEVTPLLPTQIRTVSGWLTSEAHMTALFLILAGVLSLFGYKTTPEHLQNVWDSLTHLLATIGPIIGAVPVVFNYITSRGRLKSNSAVATARIVEAYTSADPGALVNVAGVRLRPASGPGLGDLPPGEGGGSGQQGPGIGDDLPPVP